VFENRGILAFDVMKDKNRNIGRYLILIFIILLVLNILLVFSENRKSDSGVQNFSQPVFIHNENLTSVEMYLLAVDSNGTGAAAKLSVEARKGTGRTLMEINNLLFFQDTQQSIRIAGRVAQDRTGLNLLNYDLIYSVDANASVVGGPSAGASLTIATIAALEGKKPREDVIMTGAINRDGSIGPVSDILEKAKAAKAAGATIFLVPLLQSRDVVYETNQSCEKFGNSDICTTETKPRKVNISQESGLDVIEVSSIDEAESYFFN
jgi:uncharacterized protein